MKVSRLRGIYALALVLVVACSPAAQTTKPGQPVATVGKPAVIAVAQPVVDNNGGPLSAVVYVVGYAPAKSGTVAAVVILQNDRQPNKRELGRFGIFPDAPFSVDTAEARRFGFALAPGDIELLKQPGTTVGVSLEPTGGTGEGARLVIDKVDVVRGPG